MARKSNGPTSTEDVLAWRRQKQRDAERIAEQSAARGQNLMAIHGIVEAQGVKTSSTRLDINGYGRGTGSIADIGVVTPRKR